MTTNSGTSSHPEFPDKFNGECSVCGRTFGLDADGNVRRHGTVTSGPCEGSGKPCFIGQEERDHRNGVVRQPTGLSLFNRLMQETFG
jgi:hypothetical protein